MWSSFFNPVTFSCKCRISSFCAFLSTYLNKDSIPLPGRNCLVNYLIVPGYVLTSLLKCKKLIHFSACFWPVIYAIYHHFLNVFWCGNYWTWFIPLKFDNNNNNLPFSIQCLYNPNITLVTVNYQYSFPSVSATGSNSGISMHVWFNTKLIWPPFMDCSHDIFIVAMNRKLIQQFELRLIGHSLWKWLVGKPPLIRGDNLLMRRRNY